MPLLASSLIRRCRFSDLSADFSWDGERTLFGSLRVRHQTGQLRADLFDAPNDFRLNLESTISPEAIRPLVPGEGKRVFAGMAVATFACNPNGDTRHRSQSRELAGRRHSYFGANPVPRNMDERRERRIHFADGAVTCEDIQVTRDEGTGSGSFTYDFKKHEVQISNVRSSLYPAEVIFWIDPKTWKTIVPYKFRRPPNVVANGVYQFQRRQEHTSGDQGRWRRRNGLCLSWQNAAVRSCFGAITLHERTTCKLAIVRANLFAGTLRGNADISLARNDPRYHATLSVSEINFPRLTDLYFNYKTSQGMLRGTYEFTGLGNDWRTMRGKGKIEVSNGDVFAIPIFGPLSGILNHIVPGSGYSIARKATADFTVENGIIHTEDFEAAGALFSMLGHGDIHFLDDKLDFNLRLNMKGPGILLTPMYKLFEYAGEGSLKKPDWHPAVLSTR